MTMKRFLILLFLILSTKAVSQVSKFSIEANFPIPVGNNFLNENFDGVVDLGLKYRFINAKIINIGTSINGGLLQNDTNQNQGINSTAFIIQPKVFAELNLFLTKFRPFIELGYSFLIFNVDVATGLNNFTDSNTEGGFNANFGLAFDIFKKFFLQIQYDFIRLNADNNFANTSFNRSLGIIKLGLGFRL